jgi:hypothetical protein
MLRNVPYDARQRGLLHSFRVYFSIFPTRFECIFPSSPLVSSVFFHLPHSFRVYFYIFSTRFECIFPIFPTRFECIFTSSPLVSSVFFPSSPLVSSVFFPSSPLVSSVFFHLLHSFRVYFLGVLKLLLDHGFSTTFDFFYCPLDFRSRNNLGYAFLNFR